MRLRDLGGNLAARERILRALEARRLPHALLLHGPRGSGKRDAALALASALLCEAPDPDACGRCRACSRAGRGLHPDLRVVEREGQFIKVEVAREVVREAQLKPYEARAKVFVIPEAEHLSDESGNTLLKTIEEPPPATYFLLVTSSREAVLPTIRSRAQSLAFRPLSRRDIEDRLVHEGVDRAEAELRARLGSGSLASARELDVQAVVAHRSRALEMLRPLSRGRLGPEEADRLLELGESLGKSPEDVPRFLDTLRGLTRDALVLAQGGPAHLLLHPEVQAASGELAASLGARGARELLEDLDQADGDLRLNANKRLLVEALLLGVYLRAEPPAQPGPPATAPGR